MSDAPLRAWTRITIELDSPCCIGAGDGDLESDQPFVCDANGMPALPGSSLAGMLRAAFQASEEEETRWFGTSATTHARARASRVRITWGRIHDQRDRPLDRQLAGKEWTDYMVASSIGEVRDRVRISHLGVPEGSAKFDHQLVLAGSRFTFDMEIVGEGGEEQDVERVRDALLGALNRTKCRLGGAVHSGFGAFHVVRALGQVFDLRERDQFDAYRTLPVDFSAPVALPALDIPESNDNTETIEVTISPKDFFLVGGGDPSLAKAKFTRGDGKTKDPDIVPMRTHRIHWMGSQGVLSEPEVLVPATAIKGAISHRVAFHANRLQGRFVSEEEFVDPWEHTGEQNNVVKELFGLCRGGDADNEELVQTGRVLFEEVVIPEAHTHAMMHVSIDPFTAGVRNRMLFGEEVICPRSARDKPLRLVIKLTIEDPSSLSGPARAALDATLEDLRAGRLSLGGGWGRGHGYFEEADTKAAARGGAR